MEYDIYHTCRWCRFNINGKCAKSSEIFESSVSDELYELTESGKLSEAITEGISTPKMLKLKNLLEWYSISKKRQKEILKAIAGELEEFTPNLVASIDDSVRLLLINTESKVEDLEIKDPESFYCKYFE